MKEYKSDMVELRHNIDDLNRQIAKLVRHFPAMAGEVIKNIALGLYKDLIEATPVQTGTLRSRWAIRKLEPLTWRISNHTYYLPYVEFGVKNRGLSEDPEKRKKQLRYLFAKGILESVNGSIVYNYTPRPDSTGFIRKTVANWAKTAPNRMRSSMIHYLKRTLGAK